MSSSLGDVFAARPTAATGRRSLVGGSTQVKCIGCRSMQESVTKLEQELKAKESVIQMLKNRLLDSKKEMEAVKKRHNETNNDIIRGNIRLTNSVHEVQSRLKNAIVERDELLRLAAAREKEIVAMKTENEVLKKCYTEILEALDRRLVSQHFDPLLLKRRLPGASSSPLLLDINARNSNSIFSPVPFTHADLLEPGKLGRKSLHSRLQMSKEVPIATSEEKTAQAMQECPSPAFSSAPEQVDVEQSDDHNAASDQNAYQYWCQNWEGYFDQVEEKKRKVRSETPQQRKRPRSNRARRVPKRQISDYAQSSSSDGEGHFEHTPSRPIRSAKAKIASLREQKLSTKIRAGYPGTFDLEKAVPIWARKEDEAVSEQTESLTPKTPHRKLLSASTQSKRKTPRKTPEKGERESVTEIALKTPRKRDAADLEIVEEDGFRYFAKTPLTKGRRLLARSPGFFE